MEFTFFEALILIVALVIGLVIGVIVIKVAVNFNVNRWLENRDKRLIEKFMIMCPHVTVGTDEEKIFVASAFFSPSGTSAFQCELCGSITYDRDKPESNLRFWMNNLDALIERQEAVAKIHKKIYG